MVLEAFGSDIPDVPHVGEVPVGVGRRNGQGRPSVALVFPLFLLARVRVLAEDRARRRDPIQVLLEVPPPALATAGLERQVVAFLSPEVLVPLSLGPGAGPPAGLEVVEDALLPVLEALAVHELAHGAVVVVAHDFDGVLEVVQGDGLLVVEAFAAGHAAVCVVVLVQTQRVQEEVSYFVGRRRVPGRRGVEGHRVVVPPGGHRDGENAGSRSGNW